MSVARQVSRFIASSFVCGFLVDVAFARELVGVAAYQDGQRRGAHKIVVLPRAGAPLRGSVVIHGQLEVLEFVGELAGGGGLRPFEAPEAQQGLQATDEV